MHRADITRRRLHAADDITLWCEALSEMVARARRDGDQATALMAQDAEEGLLALVDHLVYGQRPSATPQREPGA